MTTKYIENFIAELPEKFYTDEVVDNFNDKIQNLTDHELIEIILSDIYIPDAYSHDSSEETIFTKLVEVVTSYVFNKIGIKSEYLKTKSSTEDIHLEIMDKKNLLHIVGDVKTYRLGRSQKGANVKDFVKPADFRSVWGPKYGEAYGLVIFPSTHEWKNKSSVYQYCTNPDYPIVMMHYSHLAVLLNEKDFRNPDISFASLWDYSDLSDQQVRNKNKENYWDIFNEKFNRLFINDTVALAEKYEEKIQKNISDIIIEYETSKKNEITIIEEKIKDLDVEELKDLSRELLSEKVAKKVDTDIKNIKKFRIE